jgi:hypothetical protein
MPTCAICNSWVFSHEKTCSKCGHEFETFSTAQNKWSPPLEETISEETNRPQTDKTRNTSGVVYLLKAGKYFKVGKTNSFERRYKDIKLQLPFKPEIVHQILTNNINRLESHWHRHFHNRRRNGEWFELKAYDLEEFISMKEVMYE